MKKILLATRPLTPPWDEASKNFAYSLAKSITEYRLTILTTPTWIEGLPANVTQEPCYTAARLDFTQKLKLLATLRKHRSHFDITHYLFTPTKRNTSLIRFFSRPKKGKTLQTVATLREDLYTRRELRALLFADKIVVYSDYSKSRLERIGFSNVSRIYPGTDLALYRPMAKDPEAMQFFNITRSDFVVMYPGEYMRLGATDMLADSLIEHYHDNPESNLKFIFACRVKYADDAKKKEEICLRFEQAGCADQIIFTDTYADMPKLYNLADVIVFPVSDMRGKFDVPLVIIEAYACGKAVILSDLPAFREFANDDICVTIPKDSGTKLMETVAYLRDNTVVREALGREARTFVEKHFDLKNTAKQYEEIYASL